MTHRRLFEIWLFALLVLAGLACKDELRVISEKPELCGAESNCQPLRAAVDELDLLFVVDDSGSMQEEQESLRLALPRLVRLLTSGDHEGDGVPDFLGVNDLHVGIVSTNMGTPGVPATPGCEGLGDDGILLHLGNRAGDEALRDCARDYPPFLSFDAERDDEARLAHDLSCIAALGTGGCGYEQPLEAALKALSPATGAISFLDSAGIAQAGLGHGDAENLGFLRESSAIAVVVITDEDDCSSHDTSHFTSASDLDRSSPLGNQGVNLRCFHNPDNLYAVDRYVDALRALRPGREDLVIFGAIAGVPADLARGEGLFNPFAGELTPPTEPRDFFTSILDDLRMQEVIDDNGTEEVDDDHLVPSCSTARGDARPPRRIVETARAFGAQNGFVRSICEDDFEPAMNVLAERVGDQLRPSCLAQPHARDAQGMIACSVFWELPTLERAPEGTPTRCDQAGWSFLHTADELPSSRDKRRVCEVDQLEVFGTRPVTDGDGWYYDDFSAGLLVECLPDSRRRVVFTAQATPPPGVSVTLRCAD